MGSWPGNILRTSLEKKLCLRVAWMSLVDRPRNEPRTGLAESRGRAALQGRVKNSKQTWALAPAVAFLSTNRMPIETAARKLMASTTRLPLKKSPPTADNATRNNPCHETFEVVDRAGLPRNRARHRACPRARHGRCRIEGGNAGASLGRSCATPRRE